jgi:Heavy metal associated domain 2
MSNSNLQEREPVLVLRSRVPGRERWSIPVLVNQPRRALALQTILASEPGILRIQANELTGRVLLEFDPNRVRDSIHNLLRRALAFGPISAIEQELLSSRGTSPFASARLFVGAELACLMFKVLFLGTLCPSAGITSVLGFMLFMGLKAGAGRPRIAQPFASAAGIVPDEPSGVEDNQDRAEVV